MASAHSLPPELTPVPSVAWSADLRRTAESGARAAGFNLFGIASVRGAGNPAEHADAQRFAAWIAANHAGEMEYLKRRDASGTLIRCSPQHSAPWARSVIVCALNYRSDSPRSIDPAPADTAWIARYAWSGRHAEDGSVVPTDYHNELLHRLHVIESALHAAPCTTRCYVDTGPLLERGLAARAGIGWIGKNTCVLNQQLGSWLLLGVIVTSLALPDEPADGQSTAQLLAPDRCGSCTRCIDACPTGALLASADPASTRTMDASRCIAYLTIEKKGSIAPELRQPMGRHVFGCDICQEVCPWNSRASRKGAGLSPAGVSPAGMEPRPELINPALAWLASLDSREFTRSFKGSPLERTGRKRLLRNVAIAMGNSGDPGFLPQLEAWSDARTPDPSQTAPLQTAQQQDTPQDPVLREAATWAREQILSQHRE